MMLRQTTESGSSGTETDSGNESPPLAAPPTPASAVDAAFGAFTPPKPLSLFDDAHLFKAMYRTPTHSPAKTDSAYDSTDASPGGVFGSGSYNYWSTAARAQGPAPWSPAAKSVGASRRRLFDSADLPSPFSLGGGSMPSSPVAKPRAAVDEGFMDAVSFPQRPQRNVFIEPGSGMRDVPMWLKSLRLHKYTQLFQQIDYHSMLALDEQALFQQGVTKGARRKILNSIKKLNERVDVMRELYKRQGTARDGAWLRATLGELWQTIQSPIRPYPLPGRPEPIQARIDGLDVPFEQLDPLNLPAHFSRLLGRAHAAAFELPPHHVDDDAFSTLLQIYDRCLNHEAFTLAQKRRVMSLKQAVKKVWAPHSRYRQQQSATTPSFGPPLGRAPSTSRWPPTTAPTVARGHSCPDAFPSYDRQLAAIVSQLAASGAFSTPAALMTYLMRACSQQQQQQLIQQQQQQQAAALQNQWLQAALAALASPAATPRRSSAPEPLARRDTSVPTYASTAPAASTSGATEAQWHASVQQLAAAMAVAGQQQQQSGGVQYPKWSSNTTTGGETCKARAASCQWTAPTTPAAKDLWQTDAAAPWSIDSLCRGVAEAALDTSSSSSQQQQQVRVSGGL